MRRQLEDTIRGTNTWRNVFVPLLSHRETSNWFAAGRPVPVPHSIKVQNLLALADVFSIETLIETGTYKGQMIWATLERFKNIYSIEVFPPLASTAKRLFSKYPHVKILEGDSSLVMLSLLPDIPEPALFWLDGHHSGYGTGQGAVACPIIAEIEAIKNLRTGIRDVLIIDDARCFTGRDGYPELSSFLSDLKKAFSVQPLISDDAIFILPQ
jgi:hypothetical protein